MRLFRRILLAAVAAAAMAALLPAAASAQCEGSGDEPCKAKPWDSSLTFFKDVPVYFVHGLSGNFPPWETSSSDCSAEWGTMMTRFRDFGYTGPFRTVKYYGNDFNCSGDGNVHHHGSHRLHYGTDYRADGHTDTGGHNEDTDIRHLAYHLAWTIYDHHHDGAGSTNVNVIGHSMGGLITRYMIARWARGQSNFPPLLMVANAITMGTPHLGSDQATLCSFDSYQCTQMRPGSDFLKWLEAYGQNPQAYPETLWTLVGAGDDNTVDETSATGMDSAHKVRFNSGQGYEHSDYHKNGSGTHSADVRWDEGWDGRGYFRWDLAPHGVKWVYRAAINSDW